MKKLICMGEYVNKEVYPADGMDLGDAIAECHLEIANIYGNYVNDYEDHTPTFFEWAYNDSFQAIWLMEHDGSVADTMAEWLEKMSYCVDWMDWNHEAGKEEYCKVWDKFKNFVEAMR